ncbi:MAG: IclR family transcriptional regulator [Desulfuromonadales bacterium]|nr:IclR family transcriptional regulator [Desulfuromonadales bacterium]
MPSRDKETYSIQAVENALDVLEALSEVDEDIRISQLSEKLAMNKTSVFRLLATFENRGYVEREERSGKYRLGLSAYEIGQKFLSRMGLLRHARPVMERLSRNCDESVYLTIRRNQEILFLDMIDTTQKVKIVSLVGKRYPLTETSCGRVLLAFEKLGSRSDVNGNSELAEQITTIQRNGYALGYGDLGEGVAVLSAPLFGNGGKLHGALCVIGPEFRLTETEMLNRITPPLFEACGVISSKLGWHASHLPPGSS